MNQAPVYDSATRPSPFVEEFLVLIRYRDLIFQLISRSVKTRYKRSLLGVAWTMINPLLTMGVLTLVFSSVFKYPGREYALYVLSGLLVWNFFAQSTSAAMVDLVWSGGLIGRVFVPKAAFAVAAIGTGLVNLVLALGAYMLIALILGARIHASVLFLPVPILITSLFALGVGLALSSVAIYFADVMPMYEVLLTAWLYLTPVIYPLDLVPEGVKVFLYLNPLYYLVDAFRTPLLDGRLPELSTIVVGFAIACLSLLLGWWVFTRKAREYAYNV